MSWQYIVAMMIRHMIAICVIWCEGFCAHIGILYHSATKTNTHASIHAIFHILQSLPICIDYKTVIFKERP